MSNAERGQTPCYFNSELIYTPLEENQRRLGFSSTQLFTRNGRSSTSLFTAEKTTDEKREAAEPQRQRQSGRTVTVVAETKKKTLCVQLGRSHCMLPIKSNTGFNQLSNPAAISSCNFLMAIFPCSMPSLRLLHAWKKKLTCVHTPSQAQLR
jgi:hypothetical protein